MRNIFYNQTKIRNCFSIDVQVNSSKVKRTVSPDIYHISGATRFCVAV